MDIFSILAVAVSLYILYYIVGAVLGVGFIFCFYFAVKKWQNHQNQEEKEWR